MITAAMLGAIQEAGEAVLTLTEGLEEGELLASRLTRGEVTRQLGVLASALRGLPASACQAMPEIDWGGWRGMSVALLQDGPARDEALWFGVRSLVPATLSWLQIYRQSHPELFVYWARSA
jgi:uncharacterized protein with HEPN domain